MSGHSNFFDTGDVRPWTKPQLKNSKPVTTWYPSTDYPIGLYTLDYGPDVGIRIQSYFDNVKFNETSQAFDAAVHLDAWADSVMNSSGCTWFDNFKHDRDFQNGKLTIKPDQLINGVSFPTEFGSHPAVIVWLSGFDVGHTGDWCFSVNVEDITTKGFQILGQVWGSTQLNYMEATWIAYPASRPNIESGHFSTLDVRDRTKPQLANSQQKDFRKKFDRVPRVYFALNKIDSFHSADKKYNLRLNAYITDTTTKGLTAHIDAWHDNNMYSSSGHWIAIQDL